MNDTEWWAIEFMMMSVLDWMIIGLVVIFIFWIAIHDAYRRSRLRQRPVPTWMHTRCPVMRMDSKHYRKDGTCKCRVKS